MERIININLLTQYRRDVYGNVVAKIDIAFKGDSFNGSPEVSYASDLGHRVTYTAYDANGHATQTTNANGIDSCVSYDALGRAVKQWQAVTDSAGQKSRVTPLPNMMRQVMSSPPSNRVATTSGGLLRK